MIRRRQAGYRALGFKEKEGEGNNVEGKVFPYAPCRLFSSPGPAARDAGGGGRCGATLSRVGLSTSHWGAGKMRKGVKR